MATIYASARGQLARVTDDNGAVLLYTDPPLTETQSLGLDGSTNAALLTDCAASPGHYLLTSGTLTRDGQAVTIAAASAAYTQRQQVYQQAQQIVSDMTTYLGLTSPTGAQTTAQVQENTRVLRWFVRHFVLGQ